MAKKGNITSRNLRLSDQIQKELAEMIQREIRDPRLGLDAAVGVADARLRARQGLLHGARRRTETAAAILKEKAGYLHSLLFKRLHIHTVPTLHFHHDTSVEHAIEMSKLINEANATRAKDDE
jgi:ribosome-binding factor A